MVFLPRAIKELILEYYWSHKTYLLKKKLHRDLVVNDFVKFILKLFAATIIGIT